MDTPEGHYVSMERIRATKRKKNPPPSVEEVFEDPYSIVSDEENESAVDGDTPSYSGTSTSGQSNHSGENPYEPFMPATRKVVLHPGPSGLGMSVAGGVKSPMGLLPVFVTDIDPGGLIDMSGVIKPGDCIVSVNGEAMDGKSHRDVVLAIKAAGNALILEVTEGPENIMKFVSHE